MLWNMHILISIQSYVGCHHFLSLIDVVSWTSTKGHRQDLKQEGVKNSNACMAREYFGTGSPAH